MKENKALTFIKNQKGVLLALFTVMFWGTHSTVAKKLVTDIPPMETIAVCSAFAFLFMLIMTICSKQIKDFKKYKAKDYGIMIALGFVGIFLYYVLYYWSMADNRLTSQVAVIIDHLWPLMIVLFSAPILKEKLTGKKIIAIVMSFVGMVVLVAGSDMLTGNKLAGVISCFFAAVFYGLFSVLNKKFNYNQNIFMTVVWIVTVICSCIVGPITEDWVPIEGTSWLGLLYLGAIVDGLAYLTWAIALNGSKDSALISNIAYLVPLISLVVAAIVLKEQLQLTAIIAVVLIFGGIILQAFNFKKKPKELKENTETNNNTDTEVK